MADSVEVSTIETTDGTIGIIRDNAARQSIANLREGKETVGSVAWENVKGRPTKVSSFENDKKYQTDENVSNTLNSTLYAGSSTHGGPATSADKLTTARTISLGGAASGSGSFDGSANSTINVSSLDATKLTGVVPITNLPPSVVERMSIVKDDTERFALTKDSVQDGDVVKVQSTNLMYYVVDDSKLSSEAGYEVFKVGSAASVPWGGVTGKPSTFPPSAHTHTKSQITDLGVFGGASATAAGSAGLVPQPAAGDQDKYLSAKGTWESITGKISGTKVTSANSADKLTTARTLNIGNTGKTFDGSANVSWSLSEIGALGTFNRSDVGDAPNFDDPGVNGLFEIRNSIETPNETGTKPFNGYGPFLSIKTRDNIAMLQIAGAGDDYFIRGIQAANVTMKGTPWRKIALSSDIPTSLPASDVSAWAKASSKPTYTASEVGAQPVGYYLTAEGWNEGTVDDLIKRKSGTSGGMGSILLTQKSSGVGSEIPAGWYNYFYSPHRTGIGADNYLWASIILTPMNFSGDSYILRCGASGDNIELVEVRNINSPEFLSATDRSVNVATVPYYSYQQLNQEFGTGDSTDTETYLKNWVKKMVKSHSNLSGINIIASANPNSAGTIIFRAYSCTDYNGTGMPEHCKGIWIGLSDLHTYEFGTSYGVWHFDRSIMANEVSVDRTANSVVRRDQYGYIFANYFNQGSPEEVPNSSSYVIYCNSDGYFRKSSFANIKKFVGGSKSVASTLLASGWSGSAAPYTYDLGPTYGANAIIGFDSAVGNTTQLEAARAADIQGSSTTKIYAYGDKPTVNIPIVIIYQ